MGLTLTLATWVLAIAGALSLARLWRGPSARAVALGVLSFGMLVMAFQIPGIMAAVTGRAVVGAPAAFLTASVLCALAWAPPVRRLRAPSEEGGPGGHGRPKARTASYPPTRPGRLLAKHVALPAITCATFFAVAVMNALSAPPRGWDVLTYHLPRAVDWLQRGDLWIHGSTGAFYPGNAEILLLSVVSTGSDRLAPLVQLPFAFLAGAAIYGLSRELGARQSSSLTAAAVFLFAPMVFFQTTIAKDDLVVASLVVAGVYFLIRALPVGGRAAGPLVVDGTRLRNVIMSGLAFGLALGTKYSILPFVMGTVPVALIALLIAGESLWRRAEGISNGTAGTARRWGMAFAATAVLVVAALVPSVFWFVRNAVASGNPIEPLTLSPSAWIGTPGLDQQFQFVPNLASWWIYPWLDRHVGGSYSGSAGFGWAFALLFLPGLVVAAFRSRAIGRSARFMTLAALVVMGIVAWWFAKHHLPRFLLPVMALACAPIGLMFDAVHGWLRKALIAVMALAATASAAEAMRVVFFEDDITWSYLGGVDREEFYAMPDFIYELPAGTKILLLKPTEHDYHQTFRYPLVGRLPGNTVVMEDDVGFSLDRRSAEGVRRGLAAAGVDYVFLRTIGLKPFTTWFDDNPDVFRKVYGDRRPSYPWYRESFAFTESGEYLGPGLAITKIYAVLSE